MDYDPKRSLAEWGNYVTYVGYFSIRTQFIINRLAVSLACVVIYFVIMW